MPLYEYRCNSCGKRFSLLVGMTAEKTTVKCPKCGSTKASKLISRLSHVGRSEEDELAGSGGEELGGDEFEDELADYGDDFDEE